MMSSTAEDADFPPNPFQPQQQQPPPVPQQQQPSQQQQGQLNAFYGEPPQPVAQGTDGQWMQPQPDSFVPQQQPPPLPPQPSSFQQPVGSGPMDNKAAPDAAATPPPPPQSRWQRFVSCCSLNTYKAYFDVDTIDITTRIKASLQTFYVPDKFRTEIVGAERNDTLKGADLYGPFWLTMTLVFFLAVTSNLHAYIHSTTEENFEYDISHLIRAMTVVSTFCFALPIVLWLMTQCMGMNTAMGMFDWICLYGYSMVPYLIATVLCLIPVEVIEWLVLIAATVVSGSLVLRNVAAPLLSADVSQTKAAPIMLCVLGFHIVFLLVLKFCFYYHHKKIVP